MSLSIRIPMNKINDDNEPKTPTNTPSISHHQIIVNGHYLGCTSKCRGCHRCRKNKDHISSYISVNNPSIN
jgi:hypothetical protein